MNGVHRRMLVTTLVAECTASKAVPQTRIQQRFWGTGGRGTNFFLDIWKIIHYIPAAQRILHGGC
jgi:hypothetical protein